MVSPESMENHPSYSYHLLLSNDPVLASLYCRQEDLDLQIRDRKKAIAVGEGEIVDSIENLVCGRHPGVEFVIADTISGSHLETAQDLNIYRCGTCNDALGTGDASSAYDCPHCGIVVGQIETRGHGDSWGIQGIDYYCRICVTKLGKKGPLLV